MLKQRILLQLDFISTNTEHDSELLALDDRLFSFYKPSTFDGNKSAEVEYNKQFESTCLIITQRTGLTIEKLTVLQFYNALDDIHKQLKYESKYGHRRQLY